MVEDDEVEVGAKETDDEVFEKKQSNVDSSAEWEETAESNEEADEKVEVVKKRRKRYCPKEKLSKRNSQQISFKFFLLVKITLNLQFV